ncbi:MAG: ANTAR domain-containing response regulator [Gammaproteobacteria bacterium]
MASETRLKRKILIIDDDRVVLATLSHGLRAAGYEVIGSGLAAEGLERAKAEQPDLVLLDVRMPDLSGSEVARRLREETRIPYIILSAFGDKEAIGWARQQGALGYLVKPMAIGQIAPAIEVALSRAEEIRSLRDSEKHLSYALEGNRQVSEAVGIVMERYRMIRGEAFELLRDQARDSRRKVPEIAKEIVESIALVNSHYSARRLKAKDTPLAN